MIEVRDGVVEVESKQRTRSRALQYLADKALEAGPLERLAVADGVADDIEELLHHHGPSRPRARVGELGPVIGAHAGPGRSACAL